MGRKLTIEEVKSRVESIKGYTLISKEYIGTKSKLKIQCPEGHEYGVRYGNFHTGRRCPFCCGKISKGEIEVGDFIGVIYDGPILRNDRTVLPYNLEIDIYLPELGLGIEYNGEYYHNLPGMPEKDGRKKEYMKELGITYVPVWERYWTNGDQKRVKEILSCLIEKRG